MMSGMQNEKKNWDNMPAGPKQIWIPAKIKNCEKKEMLGLKGLDMIR